MTADLELERVTERIQKLLALGRRGGTQAEAEAAMAKAMELLAAHNLDMAAVEGQAAGSAAREKASQAGGMYVYQRELWDAVARLNFCLHFRRHVAVEVQGKSRWEGDPGRVRTVWRNTHMIVGRRVNTRAAVVLGTYLEAVVARLCRERLATRSGAGATPGELNSQFFSSWAVAFREGIADEVIQKLADRRHKLTTEESRKRRAAERAAAAGGASTATAVTLSHYVSAEHDANIDFMWGEGTSAQWAADRAARAAEEEAEDRRLAELAVSDPAAHAAEEAERLAASRRRRGRSPRPGGCTAAATRPGARPGSRSA